MKKIKKRENLVLSATRDSVFYQIGSSGQGYHSVSKGFAKEGTTILASAAFRQHISYDFKIIGTVELKKNVDVCPCCVISTEYFDLSKYPGIVHINELVTNRLGWQDDDWIEDHWEKILRGLEMLGEYVSRKHWDTE